MPLITEQTIRSLGQQDLIYKSFASKKQDIILEQASLEYYDIFLSHAYLDKEIILGLRKYFMNYDFSVYIDWIDDAQMSREDVSKATANQLKNKMNTSACLLYAVTENYTQSKWMPWELGYFDGKEGKVAVLPMAQSGNQYEYKGTEYLGLYPFVKEITANSLYVYNDSGDGIPLRNWLNGANLNL